MDWMVDDPETFWLFGSGTPPCPSSRDWTASTVWLSMPAGEEEEEVEEGEGEGGGVKKGVRSAAI